MLIHSINIVRKMSYLHKLLGVTVLFLMLLLGNSQVQAQDATADGAAATAAPAGGGGGDAEKGKAIFTNNCAQCHAVSAEKLVGPGLKGVEERTPGKDWLHKWIKNSSALIATGDAYANQVFNANGKIQMSSFPSLSDTDIDGILAYIDQANKAPAVVAGNPAGSGQPSAAPRSGCFWPFRTLHRCTGGFAGCYVAGSGCSAGYRYNPVKSSITGYRRWCPNHLFVGSAAQNRLVGCV